MPYLHQYDYIFVIGLLFAALDAYNIGANDVANSFATSVSSRSLTMRQAVCLAAICEFLGAVLVGAKVAGTIKNGIISLSAFHANAGVQMLGFTCALVASATWLMIATRKAWPVSTTYSIVSALAGVGVALDGRSAVQWGWNNAKGLGAIFAGMLIAPAIAAGFAAVIYLITKFAVLDRKDPINKALIISPVYFFTVTAILTMSIVYKGAPSLGLANLPGSTIALAITMTALVIAVLSVLFWMPFVYAKVVKKDHTIRFYHFFYGPLLWRRPAPEASDPLAHANYVPDYRVYGRDQPGGSQSESNGTASSPSPAARGTLEEDVESKSMPPPEGLAGGHTPTQPQVPLDKVEQEDEHKLQGNLLHPRNLYIIARYKIPQVLLHGSSIDVHKLQLGSGDKEAEQQRLHEMHERARQYPNETEHLYSFLQVLTACTNSFAHGSNDVANAVGPFAAIYYVWSNGVVTPSNTPTPTWILAFGGIMIVIGLATYGYNVMAAIGNRLTMHSPSRGFSMELGAATTVLLASQYAIPVSTTMCIIGATAGVGLISGGVHALNYRAFGWVILGWILTIPIAGTSAGCLMALFLNAPHF